MLWEVCLCPTTNCADANSAQSSAFKVNNNKTVVGGIDQSIHYQESLPQSWSNSQQTMADEMLSRPQLTV